MTDKTTTTFNDTPVVTRYEAHAAPQDEVVAVPASNPEQESLKILGLAGAAAGALAGLYVLLTEKKDEETLTDTRGHATAARDEAIATLRSAWDDARSTDTAKKAKGKAKSGSNDARNELQSLLSTLKSESKGTSKDAKKATNSFMDSLKERIAELDDASRNAGDSATDQRDKAKSGANSILDNLRTYGEDMEKKSRKNRKEAVKAAKKNADDAKSNASSFVDALKANASDLETAAGGFVASTLIPKLREFGDEAASMTEQGKQKGAELSHKAKDDVIPAARDAAKQAVEQGKQTSTDFVEKLQKDYIPQAQESAHHLSEAVQPQLQSAKESAAGAIQTGEEKAKDAGKAVKRGTSETTSLLVWLSAAGALLFYVFLDDEQREKVKQVASEIFGEARDMYTDMKGDTDA